MRQVFNYFFKKNVLYKNSLYLMMSNGLVMTSGFFFWVLVTRIFPTAQVGIATSIFSLINLLSLLSLLGFTTGLMRYLPASELKNEKINASIIITACFALFLGCFTLLFMPFFSHSLVFVRNNPVLFSFFILFTVAVTLNLLSESIFTAFRASVHVFVKSIIVSICKLLLPFLFISLGAFGIVSAISFATFCGVLYAYVVFALLFQVRYRFRVHAASVKKMAFLSFGTYISGLAVTAPVYVLPILITNVIGPTATAYYYIAATTANIIFMIPQVVSQNLLVEGSYNEEQLGTHLKKAARMIAFLLVPSILILFLFGNYLLLAFGKQYSLEGFTLLKILSIAGILVGINSMFSVILMIFHKITSIIVASLVSTSIHLGLSYVLLRIGLSGIGYATIIAQFVLFVFYLASIYKAKKISLLRYLM